MDQVLFERLRGLKPAYPNIRRLRIFGSMVKGTNRADSDIDLLVDFKTTPTLFDLGGIVADFEDHLGRRVDLVMTEALLPELADKIIGEAVDV